MEIIDPRVPYKNINTIERIASVVGGGALAASGLRKGRAGVVRLIAGAAMIQRGVSGRCQVYRALGVRTAHSDATLPYELGVRARAAVTVQEPREKVFQFWRQFENLPRFMRHLILVESRDGVQSHWVAEGPGKTKVEWDAEILNEIPNELIAWRSLPGSDVTSAGSVRFGDAPGDRGTEIRVELQYSPPAGIVGAYVARLFGREPEQEIQADLGHLKQFLEGGELATIAGQPHGGIGENSRGNGTSGHGRVIEEVTA